MKPPPEAAETGSPLGSMTRVASLWSRHSRWILRGAVALMFVLAVLKLQDEIPRLIWGSGEGAATDIRKFHRLVHRWFDGEAIYRTMKVAVYPPGTYLLMWPWVGWLNLQGARLVWFVSTLFVLVGLARLLLAECRPRGRWQQAFVVLMLLSLNATGVTIGIGQLGLHLMLAMVGGLLLLTRGSVCLSRDVAGASLVLWALVKPPITAPLFWLVMFVPGRLRPAVLVVAGYVLVTLGSLIPQVMPRQDQAAESPGTAVVTAPIAPGEAMDPGDVVREELADLTFADTETDRPLQGGVEVLSDSIGMGVKGAQVGSVRGGYGNVHSWLTRLQLGRFNVVASVMILVALGYWVWRHRKVDLWILLGASALVARMWMYHRVYDDVLVLLPMVALYRLATSAARRQAGWWAGCLLAATTLVMLVPARFRQQGRIIPILFEFGHVLMWLAVLVFLVLEARHARRTSQAPEPAPGSA